MRASSSSGRLDSLTDRFDEGNAEHQRIKADLEYGGGVPDIPQQREVDVALRQVGFELVEARDLTAEGLFDIPWYEPLVGSRLSSTGFRRSAFGRKLTNAFLWLLDGSESCRAARPASRRC